MLKKQNGITLIALIITIIVMLILVGVTINVALNGGLFTKASDASKQMQIEADKEELLSAVVAAIGTDGKVVLTDIELPTGWTGESGTYTSPKGNTFTVDVNGKITYTGNNASGGNGNTTGTELSEQLELLQTYFLGEIDEKTGERPGRSFMSLIANIEDEPEQPTDAKFKDNEIIGDAYAYMSITGVGNDGELDDEGNAIYYIKYKETEYTLIVAEDLVCKAVYPKEYEENTPPAEQPEQPDEYILWTEAKNSNQTYAGASTGSSTNPIIPAGFMPKNTKGAKWDAEGGPESDNGLVIVDNAGNEFVWVPVAADISTTQYISGTDYIEPDIIVKTLNGMVQGDGSDMDSVNLQRAECEDIDKDGILESSDFKIELEDMYEAMTESVNKYDGFYVGRYETSRNGQSPQSKTGNGITTEYNSSIENDWYGLYALNKKYKTSSVQGSMMWGIQYDKMMSWMGSIADTDIGDKRNQDRTCGTAPDDVIKNVYDLYGNSLEWTLEAYGTYRRVRRGR